MPREYPSDPQWFEWEDRDPLVDAIPHDLGDVVRDALEMLDGDDFLILCQYFYERMSLSEIAAEWGWKSRQLAQYHRDKALEALQDALRIHGVEDGTEHLTE